MVFVLVIARLAAFSISLDGCPAVMKPLCMPCRGSGCEVIADTNDSTPAACCAACAANSGCAVWTLNTDQRTGGCHLKTESSASITSGDCVSGVMPRPPPPPRPKPNGRPNILFLMCDSMDGRVLDPTSDVSQKLEMPNLRKLAAEGVNFIRTYAASPQCVPSRATMFAGRRIDRIQT